MNDKKSKINNSDSKSLVLGLLSFPLIIPAAIVTLFAFNASYNARHPFDISFFYICMAVINFPAYLSVILGIKSLVDKKNHKLSEGKGLAIAGIVSGSLGFVLTILVSLGLPILWGG